MNAFANSAADLASVLDGMFFETMPFDPPSSDGLFGGPRGAFADGDYVDEDVAHRVPLEDADLKPMRGLFS
ncbi:hypothetical protein [Acuticoccus sediminis]|uniref:hypothetical protein n=1 Tax=Acuticoccus sediminis TaxID=2184697 RepID=UPI001CFD82C3|nr:hypothetical protein [Acuticoccus sediminis]